MSRSVSGDATLVGLLALALAVFLGYFGAGLRFGEDRSGDLPLDFGSGEPAGFLLTLR